MRVTERLSGVYELTYTGIRDRGGEPVTVAAPATCEVVAASGRVAASGEATVTAEGLAFELPVESSPCGSYRVIWRAAVGSETHAWRVYLDIVADWTPAPEDCPHLSASRFAELLPAAVAEVDAAIWPNAVTAATATAYRDTVAAVIGAMAEPAITSERAGAAAVTYADPVTRASLIRSRLAHTGLLYRGV